jgi:glycosyltransferase involved in cell wall biosynthesis
VASPELGMESMASAQAENPSLEKWVVLLGRKDVPADGIADYCANLAQNLTAHGIELESFRVTWVRDGWWRALRKLWTASREWRGTWVLPQYTAMAWSNRGFPINALTCSAILRWRGARCAMVFHEPFGAVGLRWIDRVRCGFQNWTVRALHRLAEKSVFTIPLNTVSWLPPGDRKSAFIPLGPNIPENLSNRGATRMENARRDTVVVFCVSESPYGEREVNDVASALRHATASGNNLRVVFVGRGTQEAKDSIDRAFAETRIEVSNLGLREAAEVTQIISEADVMIAVRGRLYLRRGSALAGVACGLPIVGYGGAAQGTLIEEAGIALVPYGDQRALGLALREILDNPKLWREMHEKNLSIQEKYLSWKVIAAKFAKHLRPHES